MEAFFLFCCSTFFNFSSRSNAAAASLSFSFSLSNRDKLVVVPVVVVLDEVVLFREGDGLVVLGRFFLETFLGTALLTVAVVVVALVVVVAEAVGVGELGDFILSFDNVFLLVIVVS